MKKIRMSAGGLQEGARLLGAWLIAGALTACGGGGGDGSSGTPTPTPTPTPPVVTAPSLTEVKLQSEPGDPLGQGKTYSYSRANAEIVVTSSGKVLSFTVMGDEDWKGEFQFADGIRTGLYEKVAIYKPSIPDQTSMRWYGMGRGCTNATGWFQLDQLDQDTSTGLRSLVLRFARYCDGASVPLKGELRFQANDSTMPPAIGATPASTWRPPAGATPATGSYVYLDSDAGDVVGLGKTKLYTPADTRMYGVMGSGYVEMYMSGPETWYGILNGPRAMPLLNAGYYPSLVRYPFANPVRGGLSWVGEGRGCMDSRGWASVDRIDYDANTGALKTIEYRFEQRCEGSAGSLRGAVRWSDDLPPFTALTAAGSWRAPADAVPSAGTYAYVNSTAGDPLLRGRTALYTPLDSAFTLTETGRDLLLEINGKDRWSVSLRPPTNGDPLVAGLYEGLKRYGETSRPSFDVAANWTGCEDAPNWVAIDNVQYTSGKLAALDVRFDLRCGNAPGTMRSEVHWRAEDRRIPMGPVTQIPTTLWQPQAGTVPTGRQTYLRVESSRADFVGAGLAATYTKADAGMKVTMQGNVLQLDVAGDQAWQATFAGPKGQERLVPGFYSGLLRQSDQNEGRGGMDIMSDARGGNTLQGWFAVDSVSYSSAGDLLDIQLRFEQHAGGSTTGGLWGKLQWTADDSTQPPGPGPVPDGLWRPSSASVPASGNYLYLEGGPGDFITSGATLTLTDANARLSLVQNQFGPTATFEADVGTYFPWTIELKTMSSRTRLEPGFYGNIVGHAFQNPAKGGLNFWGDGHGCNSLEGWFVVDEVRYNGDVIVALKARFEQSCDYSGVAHGQISWTR